MKTFLSVTAILLLTAAPALALSKSAAAQRELEGWGKAAAAYEQTCDAGKLREQMPRTKAVPAYECFANIINAHVEIQYPDLYARLDQGMKAAHHAYGTGKQDWDTTLRQLGEASDSYNEAVAKRNASSSAND